MAKIFFPGLPDKHRKYVLFELAVASSMLPEPVLIQKEKESPGEYTSRRTHKNIYTFSGSNFLQKKIESK